MILFIEYMYIYRLLVIFFLNIFFYTQTIIAQTFFHIYLSFFCKT